MGKRILIVEDDRASLKILATGLEKAGYEAGQAKDGMEGLEKVRSEKFDLIISDVMMPKMDGYEMCRLIKFDKRYKNIPFVFASSKDHENDRRIGTEIGANDFVSKPFEISAVVDVIKKHIG